MPVQKIYAFLSCILAVSFISFEVRSDSIFERVTCGEEVVNPGSGRTIRLKALQNDVLFEFVPVPEGSYYYKFKLEGFDANWTRTRYPVTRYTNLSGGEYRFVVKKYGKTGTCPCEL